MSKKVHKAEYIPQIIEDYKDNPFIEALPPIIPSMAEAVKNYRSNRHTMMLKEN